MRRQSREWSEARIQSAIKPAHSKSGMLEYSIVGSRETVRRGLESFVALTKTVELRVVCHIYDHAARVRSDEIVGEIAAQVAAPESVPSA